MPATSAGITLELRPARERGNDVVEHVLPPAGVTLAKQKHRRIPRGVAAALHPAPVAVGRQEGLYGPAERAGKVRHHGVDRNHEVERHEACRKQTNIRASPVRRAQCGDFGAVCIELQ